MLHLLRANVKPQKQWTGGLATKRVIEAMKGVNLANYLPITGAAFGKTLENVLLELRKWGEFHPARIMERRGDRL